MNEVFTPRDWENQDVRLEFPMSEVNVLRGSLGARKRGLKAKVEIHGKNYNVIGASCGGPHCMCDALLKEAA